MNVQKIKMLVNDSADGNIYPVADMTNNIVLDYPSLKHENLDAKQLYKKLKAQQQQETMSFTWYCIKEDMFIKVGESYYKKICNNIE